MGPRKGTGWGGGGVGVGWGWGGGGVGVGWGWGGGGVGVGWGWGGGVGSPQWLRAKPNFGKNVPASCNNLLEPKQFNPEVTHFNPGS